MKLGPASPRWGGKPGLCVQVGALCFIYRILIVRNCPVDMRGLVDQKTSENRFRKRQQGWELLGGGFPSK